LIEIQALSTSANIDDLRRAQDLATGEFLSGFDLGEEGFREWLDEKQRESQALRARVFESYCIASDHAGDGNEAIQSVEKLLRIDPLREDWQRLALEIYARHRGHNEAIARAKIFEDLLKRELDVPPEPQTLALLETIRSDANKNPSARAHPDGSFRGALQPDNIYPPTNAESATHSTVMSLGWYVRLGLAAVLFVSIVPALAYFYAIPPPSKPTAFPSKQSTNSGSWAPPSALQAKSRSAYRVIALAVLPFVTHSEPGSSTELIADMISDDLINSLARVPALRVISRQTTRAYRDKSTDVVKIAEELGVRYVLEGSIRQEHEKIRVNVELIDPETRQPVWSERIARAGADRTQISDEIIKQLARELQFEVYRAAAKKRADPTDVLELTYKGFTAILAASNRGRPALEEAKAYFEEALKLVPDSQEASRGIAMYHVLLVALLLTSDQATHLAAAERILSQQLVDDPNQSNAQYFMGLLHELREERDEAMVAFQRAVEINPSNALAYANMGHVLMTQGRSDQAVELIEYAMRLSPRDPHRSIWLSFFGEAEVELGRYSDAVAHLTEALSLHHNDPRSLRALVAAHALSGSIDESRRYLDSLREVAPQLTPEKLLRRPKRLQPRLAEGLTVALTQFDTQRAPSPE
jgi:TolB-like protein/Tfp pilus assembly protein PilF